VLGVPGSVCGAPSSLIGTAWYPPDAKPNVPPNLAKWRTTLHRRSRPLHTARCAWRACDNTHQSWRNRTAARQSRERCPHSTRDGGPIARQVERAQLAPGTRPTFAGTHFARHRPRLRRNSTHESASGWLTLWQLRRPTLVGQPLPRRLARSRRFSFSRRGAAIGVRPAGRTRRVPRIDRNP
jgi:hypothetical protein